MTICVQARLEILTQDYRAGRVSKTRLERWVENDLVWSNITRIS